MMANPVNRWSPLLMTVVSLATVCFLAGTHTISDGETVAALSAALSAYVGGHAVIRQQPPSSGDGSGGGNP